MQTEDACLTANWLALAHALPGGLPTAMLFRALTVRTMTRFLFAAVLCACFSAGGRALAQGSTLSGMAHKSWTARDGSPQGVTALAQAPDGVLWIGTEGGLFSFDGLTFSAFQPQPS